MKLTKSKLNKLIKEEIQNLNEQDPSAVQAILGAYRDMMAILNQAGDSPLKAQLNPKMTIIGSALGALLKK